MLIFQFYQCNLKLYKLTLPYAKFHNQSSKRNNPKLSWSFCSKFFGAKYDFFLDKQIIPHFNLYECLIYYSLSFQIMVFKHNSRFKGCRIKLLSEKKRYPWCQIPRYTSRKLILHKTERFIHVQFTSCVHGEVLNTFARRFS